MQLGMFALNLFFVLFFVKASAANVLFMAERQ